MPAPPVFVDSNVFIYAAGKSHEQREPCREFLQRVAAREISVVTSTEVIQEILHVISRRGLRQKAVDMARSVVDIIPDILAVGPEEILRACELMESSDSLGARDAIHAATALNRGYRQIFSADRHFDALSEIERVDPLEWFEGLQE